tara:strand:- start:4611 stop:5669 length:1059 start_codon:yes stop_codon:yes gene_type:complete
MANYDEIIKNIQDDRTSAAAAASRFSERNPVLLRYPLNNQQDYGGTITFKARKPQFDTLGSKAIEFLAPDFGGAPPSGFPLSDPLAEPGRPGGFNENLYKSKVDRKVTRTERLRPEIGTNRKCTLYLPGAIQIADKVSYSNVDLGILGAGIRQGILDQRSAGEIISDVAGGIKDTFGSLINSLRTGVGSEEAQIAAQRVFGASSTISGAISSATGVAVNPNRRAVLSGPELRNFAFTFRLVPTSPAEAESIEKIIQFFREEMYPDAVETAGVSAAFRYPSIFDIVMRYRTARGQYKKVATQLLPSFLQAVDVNYNQSGMSFHRDGKPQEATLTLNFTEERTLNRYDVAVRGY